MARFRFALQSVLKVREWERDKQRTRLRQALQRVQQVQQHAASLEEELQRTDAGLRQAARPGPLDIDHLLQLRRYRLILLRQLRQIQRQLQEELRRAEQCRVELVEADRKVRVLEKLQQRQLEQWQREQHQAETRFLDDLAACRRRGKS